VQVNLLYEDGSQYPADLLPDGRLDYEGAHHLGELVCRYAYDAVGRLMWKRTPTNEGLTALQRKDYYYDGVRRIQENITRPTLLMPDGGGGGGGPPQELELPSGPGNDELPVQTPGGGGQQIILGPPHLLCDEPPLPVGTLYWTDREYVYGPGYVDEFILQIDQDGVLLYMLQDANYNVVALVAGGWSGISESGVPPVNVPLPGTLLEQYAYDPYGTVIAADNLDVDQYGVSLHAVNRVGFQGLFFERYDGDYTVPSIAPDVSGMYYARNRFYSPALGRFLQRDPNETGIPIITALLMNGQSMSILMSGFDARGFFGDGMNLYLFAGANPVNGTDPSGLFTYLDITISDAIHIAGQAYNAYHTGRLVANFFKALRDGVALHEALMDFAIEAAFDWAGGKVFEFALGALSKSAISLAKKSNLVKATIARHHFWAKYLDGAPGGLTGDVVDRMHHKYHGGLLSRVYDCLHKNGLTKPRDMKWKKFFDEYPHMLERVQNAMMDYTREFDAAQGTSFLHSLWQQVAEQCWSGF